MKTKEYLSEEVLSLSKKIDDLIAINLRLLKQMDVNGKFKDKKYEDLPEEFKKLLKENGYLTALGLICDYDNIQVQQSRGVTAYHKSLVEPTIEIKPNGKESACIKLWSGVSSYQDDFLTGHELTKRNHP